MKLQMPKSFSRVRGSKSYKIITRLLAAIIILGAIGTGSIFYFIYDYAKDTKPQKSDVMVVLGCQARGETPSLMLEYRLNKALDLYKKGYAGYIIASGGQGKDETYSEAYVMKNWLKKHGVDESKIIEEEESTSTFENLNFSKKIMKDRNFKTAIIVSSDFHMFRSLKLAQRLDIKAYGAPSRTVEYLKFYYYSREILSVVKSFIFDR